MDGLKSKNGKQRSECLDDLGSIIRDYGMGVLQPSAAVCLKEMAKFIGERDTSVRNAALNAVTEAFFQVSQNVHIDKITSYAFNLGYNEYVWEWPISFVTRYNRVDLCTEVAIWNQKFNPSLKP